MKLTTILLAVLLMGLALAPDASAQTLTISGSCPGLMTFEITGAAAFSRVALVDAFDVGTFTIPGGLPCAGTVLGLDATTSLVDVTEATAGGDADFVINVPPPACGNVYVQAVDSLVCTTTGVLLVL